MHKSIRGIIKKDNSIILIHRIKSKPDGAVRDYYVVPGGKMEIDESEEETVIREIYEELGIKVKPVERIVEYYFDYDDSVQVFYLCNYLSGTIGTGNGPEITNKTEYTGIFEPVLINKNEVENINLVPEEIKDVIGSI